MPTFDDVSEEYCFYDAVQFVLEHELMNGTTETTFAPDETISRAMAVVTLYRLAGEPEVAFEQVFDDVSPECWFGDAVVWAYQQAIVQGDDDVYFAPDEDITKEQFVIMLYRFAGLMEHDAEVLTDFYLSDAELIYEWAALHWANYKGLIEGDEDGSLEPDGTISRAECAVILYRFVAMLDGESEKLEYGMRGDYLPSTF